MANPTHLSPKRQLLKFLLDSYADDLSNAGCNDMPQRAFDGLSESERETLRMEFVEWARTVNGDGFPPLNLKLAHITDIEWTKFLKHSIDTL